MAGPSASVARTAGPPDQRAGLDPRAASRRVNAAPITAPTLVWRDRTLANGLRVLTVEDHGSPTVSVQVWYRVGSKDDPDGRSGFAHLFEHMMFKSTRYLANEQFDRMTEDVGGMNNASTWSDLTEYHEVVPSNHLERLLWAEAERMANLDVSEENFRSERSVVQEEYRQRVLAQPYGRLFQLMSQYTYRVHPYKRPGIGSIEELDAATLADVRLFHSTYYRPDNAVLLVAGDFSASQLDGWIDKYFAALAHPSAPVPRVAVSEPPWPDDRRVDLAAPGVPLPAVALAWLGPHATHADVPALRVAEALLSQGESSRLNQALVYRAQLASQANFSFDRSADSSLLVASAVVAHGRSVEDSARALRAQLERLVRGPIAAAELDKVRTQLVTQALIERQTPLGRAQALGQATVLEGDPGRVNRELEELQAVTAQDVRRVMRQWVLGARHTRITYGAAASSGSAPGSPAGKSRAVRAGSRP